MTSGEEVKGEGFEVDDHQGPRQPADGTPSEGDRDPLPAVDVYAILRISVAQLAVVAWQMMGLQPDPFTQQVRRDLEQARVAIDAASALVDLLRPHLGGQEARDYQTLLTDLRLNFVSHSREPAVGPEPNAAS